MASKILVSVKNEYQYQTLTNIKQISSERVQFKNEIF